MTLPSILSWVDRADKYRSGKFEKFMQQLQRKVCGCDACEAEAARKKKALAAENQVKSAAADAAMEALLAEEAAEKSAKEKKAKKKKKTRPASDANPEPESEPSTAVPSPDSGSQKAALAEPCSRVHWIQISIRSIHFHFCHFYLGEGQSIKILSTYLL